MNDVWQDAEDAPSCITVFYDVGVHCPCGVTINFSSSEVKQCHECGKIYKTDLMVYEKIILDAQEECDDGSVNFVQNFGDWLNKQ